MRLDQSMRDQVQPQVGVVGVDGLVGQHRDGTDRDDLDATVGIRAGHCGQFGGDVVG